MLVLFRRLQFRVLLVLAELMQVLLNQALLAVQLMALRLQQSMLSRMSYHMIQSLQTQPRYSIRLELAEPSSCQSCRLCHL
jgi:hypothetical protein